MLQLYKHVKEFNYWFLSEIWITIAPLPRVDHFLVYSFIHSLAYSAVDICWNSIFCLLKSAKTSRVLNLFFLFLLSFILCICSWCPSLIFLLKSIWVNYKENTPPLQIFFPDNIACSGRPCLEHSIICLWAL